MQPDKLKHKLKRIDFINKNCCIVITVFTIIDLNMSASKPVPADCLKVRETMFEFLKRKKHNEL